MIYKPYKYLYFTSRTVGYNRCKYVQRSKHNIFKKTKSIDVCSLVLISMAIVCQMWLEFEEVICRESPTGSTQFSLCKFKLQLLVREVDRRITSCWRPLRPGSQNLVTSLKSTLDITHRTVVSLLSSQSWIVQSWIIVQTDYRFGWRTSC